MWRHQDRQTEVEGDAEGNREADRTQHRDRRPCQHAEHQQRGQYAHDRGMQGAPLLGWIAGIALWTMIIGPVLDAGANRTAVKARISQSHGR